MGIFRRWEEVALAEVLLQKSPCMRRSAPGHDLRRPSHNHLPTRVPPLGPQIDHVIGDLELNGYHCAWMAPNDVAAEIVAADEATRRVGLGASSVAEEAAVLKQWFGEARTAFAKLGFTLRRFSHPRLGEV